MDAPGGRTARAAAGAPIIVFLLGLLYIVSYLDRLILALLVAPVRAEFGISDTAIALLVGPVFALFGGLFALPMGWLVDRANRTRSEEHTSELQSLMRISYAVFCLKNTILLINIHMLYIT